MKLLLTIVLLSSVLFSMQIEKQIILGSYSVKTNAVNAANILRKQIENDDKLRIFMKHNSLNVTNTTISGYTVVSVNTFKSYAILFRGIKRFQKYYDDAYVLSYPAGNIVKKELLAEVQEKAIQEQKLEEEKLKEEKLEEEIFEQIRLEGLASKKLEEDRRLEEELLKIEKDIRAQKERKEVKALESLKSKKDEAIDFSDYYLFILLAALILIIGSVVISKKFNKKDETKEDENIETE